MPNISGMLEIAVLAQRSERLCSLIDCGLRRAGIRCRVFPFSCGERFDVLAAFDSQSPVPTVCPAYDGIAVAYSGSGRVKQALSGSGIPCVTCGTGACDSVTISSIGRGRAMLTVQRDIPTAAGETIEPMEIPVSFGGCDIFKAVFAASVMLVCGCDGELVLCPSAAPPFPIAVAPE